MIDDDLFPLTAADAKKYFGDNWLKTLDAKNIPSAPDTPVNNYLNKRIELDRAAAFGTASKYKNIADIGRNLQNKVNNIDNINDTILSSNSKKLEELYNHAAYNNPINDRVRLGFAALGGLTGAGAGLGLGHLASLMVNKDKKKTRNVIRALGAIGGGALGAYVSPKFIPDDLTHTHRYWWLSSIPGGSTYTPANDILDVGNSYKQPMVGAHAFSNIGFDNAEQGYEKWLHPYKTNISADEMLSADKNLFNHAQNVRDVATSNARGLTRINNAYDHLDKRINKANLQVTESNKTISDFNKSDPLGQIAKARNAQFKRWGTYGGGALGGLTGALGAGYLSKGLLKSKDKRKRILGALLTGLGGVGGMYLGGKLGGGLTGNLAKHPGMQPNLEMFRSYQR